MTLVNFIAYCDYLPNHLDRFHLIGIIIAITSETTFVHDMKLQGKNSDNIGNWQYIWMNPITSEFSLSGHGLTSQTTKTTLDIS